MANNINCTCGHSWSKASSSKKDMYICHICGKNNTMKDGGWLSKFEEGGMVLEQQANDNYGKKLNPNDVQASVGPGFVGLGYNTKGRNYSPAWGGQFQDGGYIDSVLNANKHLDWVKRLYEKNTPSIQIPGQKGRSTHFMESGDGRVYPTVVKMADGKLKYLGDKAYDYADSTKTYIQFPSDKEAQLFGQNYKKGKGVLKELAMGGNMPGAVGFMYARTQNPAPSNGKYAKKTKASAQDGKVIQEKRHSDLYSPIENKIDAAVKTYDEYYNLPGSTQMFIDMKVKGSSYKGNRNIPPIDPIISEVQQKIKGLSDKEVNKLLNTDWSKMGVIGAMKNAPSNISYPEMLKYISHFNKLKKKGYTFQNGGEMRFYQEGLDFKPKTISQNGAIIDPMGQLAHPGEITIIPSTDITMEGVDYPVLGISDTGDEQMMYPGEDYQFDGDYVTEYPMMKEGGWLSKYQDGGGLSRSNLETMAALEKDIKNQKARNAQETVSQYTPKPGDQQRMNAAKDAYRAEEAKPLNRLANNPHIIAGDKNLPGAIEFALDVMTAGEATAALNTVAKPALKAAAKYATEKTALKNASIINNDAAGSIDDIINKWWRRETAPGTKHEDAINVLSEFKQRIKTPEGQKRLKELGISNDQFLQKLKIIEDNTEYGYYNDGKIGLHKDVPNASTVARHEIEHGVQGALGRDALMAAKKGTVDDKMAALSVGPTKIDDILSKLELRKTPNKVVRRPGNLNDIYLDPYEFNRRMSDKQAATDYFTYGSEGREKSAFAAEAQQYMLDKGIIKHPYENITPDKVRNAMVEAQFDKETYPIRLFHIMKNTDNNYKKVADALNKMLTVSPILAGGAATLTSSKEKKNGGWLNKYK